MTAAAFVVAPALFLADNLLHPKEFERGNEAEQLAEIADAYTRWQLAHAFGFAAILVFAVAVVGLAYLVGRRAPGVGLAGGALGVAGLLGLAAAITIDGYTWAVLGEVSVKPGADPETVQLALKDVQESTWSYLYYLTPLGFILGVIVLAAGAWRNGLVPAGTAALLGLAVLMVGTETTIVSNAYFIAGAAVFLAAGGGGGRGRCSGQPLPDLVEHDAPAELHGQPRAGPHVDHRPSALANLDLAAEQGAQQEAAAPVASSSAIP